MRPTDVLYVPASAATLDDCERRLVGRLEDLQALVGGYVEEVWVPAAEDVVMYGNEDGLRLGLPANVLASLALAHYGARAGTPLIQTIVGDVVFFGYDRATGERDVPASFLRDLESVLPRTPVEGA